MATFSETRGPKQNKNKKCKQKVRNVFNQFDITIPCSATYFLEVGAHVSLKVATKGNLENLDFLVVFL